MSRHGLRSLPAVTLVAVLVLAACAPAAAPSPTPAARTPAATPAAPTPAAAVQPTRPVEFVISTPPGGGSDIYARAWIAAIEKEKLSPVTYLPVNREGGAGAVAFTYLFERKGDMHYVMSTLNSFFTTMLDQKGKLPYTYKDFTPIAILALDPFFLWVDNDSAWKTAKDFIDAAVKDEIVVAGTGAKQEDEIIFKTIQDLAKTKPFKYVSFPGGGQVAAALAGKQVKATVNNPSEGLALFQASPPKVRPICTFQNASPTAGPYKGLATCKSQGFDLGFEYFIMRSVVGPPGLSEAQVKFHVEIFKKVSDSAEWKAFAEKNVLDRKYVTGAELAKFLDDYNKFHEDAMRKAGFIK